MRQIRILSQRVVFFILLATIVTSSPLFAAQMQIAWDANVESNLSGYKVYDGTASGTYGSPINAGKATTYTLSGLTQGQTYYVVVTAYDTLNNESSCSNEVSGVATDPIQTTAITVTTNPAGLQVVVDSISYTAPRTFTWTAGSSHTLSVSSPQNGASGIRYAYSLWSNSGAQTHSITVPSSATTYTASFTTQYSLTSVVSPSGSGSVSPSGTNWYNSSQGVSVTAGSGAGYSFSNWTGGLTGSTNPVSITMSGPKSVTANFTQNQYTLTVSASPSGSGSVSKSPSKSTYVYGEQVALTATANLGYGFSSWSGDASGSTNPVTLTINGNKTLTAAFSAIPETVSTPTTPSGTTSGIAGTSYSYSTGGSSSNLGNSVQYFYDWGNGSNSGWLPAGTTIASKSWASAGIYSVKTQARCSTHNSVVSSWSGSLSVTIACPTPATPSGSSPSNGGTGVSTSPTLSWTSSNAASYDVYFGTSSNPPLAGNTTSTSYPRSGLSYSTAYYWKVVAKNSCGNSTSGSVWSFTTVVAAPGVPTVSSPSNGATGVSCSPSLTWNASIGANTYRVQASTSSGFSSTVVDQSGVSGTSSAVSGLSNSTIYYWRVNATNAGGTSVWSSAWSFTTLTHPKSPGKVDFNNDGKTDILWRLKSSGGLYAWYMDGITVTGGAWVMGSTDLTWEVVGMGDFNSDGKTDILWKDKTTGGVYAWYMDGITVADGAWVTGSTDLTWEIVGTGDFNSDGKTDILWRLKSSGGLYVWYMDGVNVTGGAWLMGSSDLTWEIVGTGDFNSDGKTDILWRDKTTGGVYAWYMDGISVTDGAWVMGSTDLTWEIVGTGDFNSDSKTDILWKLKSSGGLYIWYMDGVNLTGGAWLMGSSDLNWEIVAP